MALIGKGECVPTWSGSSSLAVFKDTVLPAVAWVLRKLQPIAMKDTCSVDADLQCIPTRATRPPRGFLPTLPCLPQRLWRWHSLITCSFCSRFWSSAEWVSLCVGSLCSRRGCLEPLFSWFNSMGPAEPGKCFRNLLWELTHWHAADLNDCFWTSW